LTNAASVHVHMRLQTRGWAEPNRWVGGRMRVLPKGRTYNSEGAHDMKLEGAYHNGSKSVGTQQAVLRVAAGCKSIAQVWRRLIECGCRRLHKGA
jgi:hypothetical protein